MNRKISFDSQKCLFLTAITLLYAGFILNAVAVDSVQPVQHSNEFQILYHEPIEFQMVQMDSGGSGDLSKSAAQKKSNKMLMSFDALGQHFELILDSNQQLIKNLPQQQKDHLNKTLQLYRGKLKGNEESWVRITQAGKRVSGMIWDGSEIYIIDNSTDVSKALGNNGKSAYSLIYRLSDAEMDKQSCGVDSSAHSVNDYQGLIKELKDNIDALPQANSKLDIAIVADTQFVNSNANPDAAVVARMNVVDGIYSEQVGVHLNVTEIRALQNNSGLSSSNPGTLLDQFSSFSNSNGFNNPGLAHLFTGRDLSGSTIGIAYIDSLCSTRFGVGISQIDDVGTSGALTVAHELGHNFGAPHDNQSGSVCASTSGNFIMNPFIISSNDRFSQCSLTQMQQSIQNAACITNNDVTPLADVRVSLPKNPISTTINKAFNFQIEVGNSGNTKATNVMASISIADELVVQSAQVNGGDCVISASNVNCELNDIDSNGVKKVNLTLQSDQTGRFISAIQVSADNESNLANNKANAEIRVQDIGNNGFFSSHFDSDRDGFAYRDDTFRNTNQPFYARSSYTANQGFTGGGLKILIGGRDNKDITEMSGGWERTFNLATAEDVTLSLRYKLSQSKDYETDEISEALVSIDGNLIGRQGVNYLARILGDGNGGSKKTTGWQLVNFDLGQLSAGSHTLTIGGFNNKKTYRNESSEILIDDVVIAKDTTPDTPTAQCPSGAKSSTNGKDLDFCWFENLSVPAKARPYCSYLNSDQTIGYYFDSRLNAKCPNSARSSSNGQGLDFCLFEDISVPKGAKALCDELTTKQRIGYSYPSK